MQWTQKTDKLLFPFLGDPVPHIVHFLQKLVNLSLLFELPHCETIRKKRSKADFAKTKVLELNVYALLAFCPQ